MRIIETGWNPKEKAQKGSPNVIQKTEVSIEDGAVGDEVECKEKAACKNLAVHPAVAQAEHDKLCRGKNSVELHVIKYRSQWQTGQHDVHAHEENPKIPLILAAKKRIRDELVDKGRQREQVLAPRLVQIELVDQGLGHALVAPGFDFFWSGVALTHRNNEFVASLP
eukprot:scaffold6007_cov183-Amphora_coffeaeformis.AAC.22